MPPLTATIITLNEAKNIGRCIRSLRCADEIVVVDAGSTDGTERLAAELGARVVVHPWGGFAAQKNFAAQQAQFDWILGLDADEELDAEAQSAVLEWKASHPAAGGFEFARRARYLGRWILHSGWYPDYKLRLYDRRRGQWEGAYVHESIRVEGRVERLRGEILHHTCDSLQEHKERIEFYTDLAAAEMAGRRESPGSWSGLLALWTFLETYFLRLGVLDGYQGFLIAWMAARYVRRKYAKLARLRKTIPEAQKAATGSR
jgi:glycosyltransferase involved in cell wall biosynthesis